LAAGFTEDEFWSKTPRQIALAYQAREIRLRREHNDRAWLAWHIAALQRTQKRLPPITKLMFKEKIIKPQTWQEQRRVVRIMNAMFGGIDKSKVN
jgi:hypothetical protein